MKKILIPVAILAVIGILIYSKAVGTYNQFVQLEEEINGQWAEVQTQYWTTALVALTCPYLNGFKILCHVTVQ